MKIDKAVLLASIALSLSLVAVGLQFLPQNIMTPLTGLETHAWRLIASFEGTGNTTTSTFYVPSYLWKISLSITFADLTKPGSLRAGTFSPGAVENWQNSFVTFGEHTEPIPPSFQRKQVNQSRDFSGSGNEYFYFKVECVNVETWTLRVEAWS